MEPLRKKTLFLAITFLLTLSLFAPAGAKDYLYVPCSNYLHIIDCDTDTVVKTLSYNDYIIGCVASDDGKRFYLNAWRSVYVVDTDKNQIIDRYDFWTELNRINVGAAMAVSRDGKYLYMVWNVTKKKMNVPRLNVLPPTFVVFDMAKREVVKSYEVPSNSNGVLTLKDDPDHVIIMCEDVVRLNINTGETEKMLGLLHPEEGKPQSEFPHPDREQEPRGSRPGQRPCVRGGGSAEDPGSGRLRPGPRDRGRTGGLCAGHAEGDDRRRKAPGWGPLVVLHDR